MRFGPQFTIFFDTVTFGAAFFEIFIAKIVLLGAKSQIFSSIGRISGHPFSIVRIKFFFCAQRIFRLCAHNFCGKALRAAGAGWYACRAYCRFFGILYFCCPEDSGFETNGRHLYTYTFLRFPVRLLRVLLHGVGGGSAAALCGEAVPRD